MNDVRFGRGRGLLALLSCAWLLTCVAFPACERRVAGPDASKTSGGGGEGAGAGPSTAASQGVTMRGYTVDEVADPGRLEVTCLFEGPIPPAEPVDVNINVEHCGGKVFKEDLVVDAESRGLRDVVVRLEGITRGKDAPESLDISNKDCAFRPHVRVAVVKQRGLKGTKVMPRNEDPFLHTTAATLNGVQIFNAPLAQAGAVYPGKVPSETGLMELHCDVHKWMNAFVYVHSNPYAEVSDAQGKLLIDKVPPATHRWVAWHPTLGEQKGEIEIPPGGTARLELNWKRP